jgi:hypothetical protein
MRLMTHHPVLSMAGSPPFTITKIFDGLGSSHEELIVWAKRLMKTRVVD